LRGRAAFTNDLRKLAVYGLATFGGTNKWHYRNVRIEVVCS
jgi:hypothetical protein